MDVSIAMITYNHEEFIAKAIDSILMQNTNFDYEIVIGEDCSTDNSRNIIVEYQKKYPDKIRLLLNEKNLGAFNNAKQTFESCKGRYVAVLEGDDYWVSPDKLQKQVDFLENHPECVICFHNATVIYQDGCRNPVICCSPTQKEISSGTDLLVLGNFMPTCTKMYRNVLLGEVPEWVSALKMGDWPIDILIAQHGKLGYIDEIMSVYVVHGGGLWSTKGWQYQATAEIEMFEALNKHLGPEYKRIIRRILCWRYFSISEKYENIGEVADAGKYAFKSLEKRIESLREPFEFGNNDDLNADNLIPDYMKSVTGAKLLKKILRLSVIIVVQPYPTLYKFIRAAARTLYSKSKNVC